MIDFELLDKRFNASEWADVLEILDEYFNEHPLPTYSDLKNSITHSLNSANAPNPPLVQALKIQINELKNICITDDEFNKQKRELANQQERKIKSYYEYLVRFPYHKQYSTLNRHFKTINDLKVKTLVVSGKSRKVEKLQKFELITKHFLPNTMSRGGALPPDVIGYTKSNFAADEHAIAAQLISHLLGSQEEIEEEYIKIKEQFINAIKQRLVHATLVLPYVITENATDDHYKRVLDFLNQYWQPLIAELKAESTQYTNKALILLLLVEQKIEEEIPGFTVLDESSKYDTLSDNVKIQINPIQELDCTDWINKDDGFFIHYAIESEKILDGNHKNYFPDCETIEGFFEKITADIFNADTSLYQILKQKST